MVTRPLRRAAAASFTSVLKMHFMFLRAKYSGCHCTPIMKVRLGISTASTRPSGP